MADKAAGGIEDLLEHVNFLRSRFESKAAWALPPPAGATKPAGTLLAAAGDPTRPQTILDAPAADSSMAVKLGGHAPEASFGSTKAERAKAAAASKSGARTAPFCGALQTELADEVRRLKQPGVGSDGKPAGAAGPVRYDKIILNGEAVALALNMQSAYAESSMDGFERRLRALSVERGNGKMGGVFANLATVGQLMGDHLGLAAEAKS